MPSPTIYTLQNDAHAAKFGLQPWERDRFMEGCFPNRQGQVPRAIFCHVQEGTTRGSLDWAINKSGSQNSYTVTVQQDGSILQCIPERHGPWTNGAIRSPKARSQKLRNLGGNINNYSLTMELEGYWNGPHSEAQIAAAMWQIEDWMRRYPAIDPSWVFEHADVDTIERINCAGSYYDKIRAWLDGTITAPPPTTTDPQFGQIVKFSKPVRITCHVNVLNVRQWAETADYSKIVHDLKHGETAWADGYVYGEQVGDTRLWYVLSGRGYRAWSGGTDRVGLPPGQ